MKILPTNNNDTYNDPAYHVANYLSMLVLNTQLFTEEMPITCGNFIDLANSGFYDGLHFHRLRPLRAHDS